MKSNMEKTHPTVKRIHWYILILTLAFLGLAIFIFTTLSGTTKLQSFEELKQSLFTLNKESLTLKQKESVRSYSVGQPVNIQVVANSQGNDIVAFDALFTYDRDAFDEPEITTTLSGFSVVPFQRDTHLSLTAMQTPGNKERSVFDNTEILNLKFTPKKIGRYEISLIPKTLDETTKLMTTENKKILPKTSTITIEVY
jgi:hypothetical protein